MPAVSSVHDTADFYRREPYRSTSRMIGRLPARRIAYFRARRAYSASPPRTARTDSFVYYGIDVARGWSIRWSAGAPASR